MKLIIIFLSFNLIARIPNLPIDGRKSPIVQLPSNFSHQVKYPLVISLHGFSSNPSIQERIFPAEDFVDIKEFVLIKPFGERNKIGFRFWNAGSNCCDFFHQAPDDISYLKKIITHAINSLSIDAKKVFLVGHSNGGFLAYKMACEASNMISGIVSIAGSNFFEHGTCKVNRPISVIQIHGKNDGIVKYKGDTKRRFPSAEDTVLTWAKINNCGLSEIFPINSNFSKRVFSDCEGESFVELWEFGKRRHNQSLGSELTYKVLNKLF